MQGARQPTHSASAVVSRSTEILTQLTGTYLKDQAKAEDLTHDVFELQ